MATVTNKRKVLSVEDMLKWHDKQTMEKIKLTCVENSVS